MRQFAPWGEVKRWSCNVNTLQLGQLQEALRTAAFNGAGFGDAAEYTVDTARPPEVEGCELLCSTNMGPRQQKGVLIAGNRSGALKGAASSPTEVEQGRTLAVRAKSNSHDFMLITAYAPVDMLATAADERGRFWTALNKFTSSLPAWTTPIVGGDFNAHLGFTQGDEAIGRCGADKRDTPNGEEFRTWATSWEGLLWSLPPTWQGELHRGRGKDQTSRREAESMFGSFHADANPR